MVKAGLAALVLGLVVAAPAAGVAPFALTDQIDDRTGAVEGRVAEIRTAFDAVEAEHGVRMWVVFVDSFDGVRPQQWAEDAFEATRLGGNDFLLAMATSDRQYGYIVASDFVLDDAALAAAARAGEPAMAENPARAVIDIAQAIGVLIAGGSSVTPAPDEGGSGSGTIPFVLAMVAVGVGVVGNGIRRMRKGLPFFAPNAGGGASDRDTWSSHGGSPGGGGSTGRGGGGGTRGGSGSF